MSIEQSKLVYPRSESADFVTRTFSQILSWIYALLVFLRNSAYDLGLKPQHVLPGSVYSIGNIAVGGTGKTPVVIALVKKLKGKGLSPVVLTRGYGSSLKKHEWIVLRDGELIGGNISPSQLPDEARLQSVECVGVPIVAGARRFDAAQSYLSTFARDPQPTHWVLDDGFQHRGIHRDIDIVLIDKTNPIGNGKLLPFGFLREPLESVKRATHVFFTGNGVMSPSAARNISDIDPSIQTAEIFSQSKKIDVDISGVVKFTDVCHKKIFIVAAIARPERLLQDLKAEGIEPTQKLFLPDHHNISTSKLSEFLVGAEAVITTAKDYWRNPDVFTSLKIPVFIKKVEIILPEAVVSQFC